VLEHRPGITRNARKSRCGPPLWTRKEPRNREGRGAPGLDQPPTGREGGQSSRSGC
jgi:hypothetical protein